MKVKIYVINENHLTKYYGLATLDNQVLPYKPK